MFGIGVGELIVVGIILAILVIAIGSIGSKRRRP
jgi:hypothetical protein